MDCVFYYLSLLLTEYVPFHKWFSRVLMSQGVQLVDRLDQIEIIYHSRIAYTLDFDTIINRNLAFDTITESYNANLGICIYYSWR